MSVATALLTAEDLLQLPRDHGRYELVEGVLHRMPPPGFEHGSVAAQFAGFSSRTFMRNKLGRVLAAETRVPDRVRARYRAGLRRLLPQQRALQEAAFDRQK